jgi:hypothetical protein
MGEQISLLWTTQGREEGIGDLLLQVKKGRGGFRKNNGATLYAGRREYYINFART